MWQELTAAQETVVMAAPAEEVEGGEAPPADVLEIQWQQELTAVRHITHPVLRSSFVQL